MSLLRRIINNPSVSSKAIPIAKKTFVPFPLGRDPSSLPKLEPVSRGYYIDRRPISLRYRVRTMLEMSNLVEAVKISRLAVSDDFRGDGRDRDTVFICNSVIGAMWEAKRYDEAISLFNYFFNESETLPNTLSCNLIIQAHCERGRIEDALDLYRHIILLGDERLAPGIETYRILTKAIVGARRLDEACDFVRSMPRCDFIVYNILIRGFLDVGKFVKASQILDGLKEPSSKLKLPLPCRDYHKAIAIAKASFMNYWFKQGKDEEAMEIYANLVEEEKAELLLFPVVGNRFLEVLVEHSKRTEAWELFREMIEICDSETIEIMLKDFGGDEKIEPLRLVRRTCYRTMIARLCENGKVLEAEKLFDEMLLEVEGDEDEALGVGPDVVTWRAMINGYVKVGRIDDAIKTLNKMRIWNIRKLAIHRAP